MDPDNRQNWTRPYQGEHFPALSPEPGLEHTSAAPGLGMPVPTSPGELIKILLGIQTELHLQAAAWERHWIEEQRRRNAWVHLFPFRLAAGQVQDFPQVSGLDVKFLKIVSVATTANEGLLYAKLASSIDLIAPGGLPYPNDYDYVLKTSVVSPILPCREAQAFCLYATQAVDGVCYFAGSREAIGS
jgi:hypothetical protein